MKTRAMFQKVLTILLSSALIVALTACKGVSQKEYDELKRKYDELVSKFDEVDKDVKVNDDVPPVSGLINNDDGGEVPPQGNDPAPLDIPKTPVSDFEYEYDATLEGVIITRHIGKSLKVYVPDAIEDYPVKAVRGIDSSVFGAGVAYVHIPDGVTEIGYYAFNGCTGLTSINIPDSVTEIGSYAFDGCTGLASIHIPDGVTGIGYCVFNGCMGLTSMNIPDGVTYIGDFAFNGCTGLTSINIPDGVTYIGYCAFNGCTGLTSMDIPDSVMEIGSYAFDGCTGLTSINIPDGVTYIGYCVFNGCMGLTSMNFPDGVTYIGDYAFNGCTGLTSINIPDGVTYISYCAFGGCVGLTRINIPDSVTYIGDYAFNGCTGLTRLYIPDGVAYIGNYAFSGCINLASVTIPAGVRGFNTSIFANCGDININRLDVLKDSFSSAVVGNTILFGGTYWKVIDIQDDKALVVAEGITDIYPYNDDYINITWENCTLRAYLNGEFYNDTFTDGEKALIVETTVFNNDSPYGTIGGHDTVDKVFLLSIDEVNYYFAEDYDRFAYDSDGMASWWWLRSPGADNGNAAYVGSSGDIDIDGIVVYYYVGVRPAFWLNLQPTIL